MAFEGGEEPARVTDTLSPAPPPSPQLLALPRGWPALCLCGPCSRHCPGMCPFSVPGGVWPRGSTPLCAPAPTWGFPCQEGTW